MNETIRQITSSIHDAVITLFNIAASRLVKIDPEEAVGENIGESGVKISDKEIGNQPEQPRLSLEQRYFYQFGIF